MRKNLLNRLMPWAVFFGLFSQSVLAQTFSTIGGATVQNGIFTYSYTIANAPDSIGSIWLADVDISRPSGGVSLSGQGLFNGNGFATNSANALLKQPQTIPTVPVGFEAPPNWIATPTVSGKAQWTATDTSFLIFPGQSVSGFQLTSPGLPAIRAFSVEACLDADAVPILPPTGPSDIPRYLNDLNALEAHATIQGSTIAPMAPPANFDTVKFLQTIQNYKEQAVKLGWIDNPGIANSLDAKISAALLSAGDGRTAKNILNALVNEADA